jgi:acetyl-CoA carboxylase alpha subunit
LRLQISSHEHEKEQFESDVKELEGRITSLTVRATEAEELADKRRQTINEMSTKGHEKDQEYRSKLNKMKEQWKVCRRGRLLCILLQRIVFLYIATSQCNNRM